MFSDGDEKLFQSLMEAAPDAIVIVDGHGKIVWANSQVHALFGYSSAQVLDQPVEKLIPERYTDKHKQHRSHYIDSPSVRPMGSAMGRELFGLRQDGTEFPIAISLSPLTTESGKLIFCDIRDMTLQREVEKSITELNQRLLTQNDELVVMNKELEAFSYSVSHDLRTPLRAIDGFSRVLEEELRETSNEACLGYLSRVRSAAQRMGCLIDDLLKLSRITRADMVINEVNLSLVARQLEHNLHQQSPERIAEFAIDSIKVRGDERLLTVALENLLNNAWKFTSKNRQTLIELGSVEQENETVYFVRDNGVGFDMNYADKLFGAFQRLHSDEAFSGTGIGLATVARVIHKHGGRIWAESAPNQGTSFYFTLGRQAV